MQLPAPGTSAGSHPAAAPTMPPAPPMGVSSGGHGHPAKGEALGVAWLGFETMSGARAGKGWDAVNAGEPLAGSAFRAIRSIHGFFPWSCTFVAEWKSQGRRISRTACRARTGIGAAAHVPMLGSSEHPFGSCVLTAII